MIYAMCTSLRVYEPRADLGIICDIKNIYKCIQKYQTLIPLSIVSNHIFINIIQYRVKQNIIDALYGFGSIFHVFVA